MSAPAPDGGFGWQITTKSDAQETIRFCTAVMQVDVDPSAVPLRKPEHDIQMPYRIAIGSGWVDPADHLDTVPESLVEQFGGARIGEHAVLRERHVLDGDPAAEALPGPPTPPPPRPARGR